MGRGKSRGSLNLDYEKLEIVIDGLMNQTRLSLE
jgi:hypothetical protein